MAEEKLSRVEKMLNAFRRLSLEKLLAQTYQRDVLVVDVAVLVLSRKAADVKDAGLAETVFERFRHVLNSPRFIVRTKCYAIQGIAGIARGNDALKPKARALIMDKIRNKKTPIEIRKAGLDYPQRSWDYDPEFMKLVHSIINIGMVKRFLKGIPKSLQSHAKDIFLPGWRRTRFSRRK